MFDNGGARGHGLYMIDCTAYTIDEIPLGDRFY